MRLAEKKNLTLVCIKVSLVCSFLGRSRISCRIMGDCTAPIIDRPAWKAVYSLQLLAIHVHLIRQACNAEYTNYYLCVLPNVYHNILKVTEFYIALDWFKCKFLFKAVVTNGNLV